MIRFFYKIIDIITGDGGHQYAKFNYINLKMELNVKIKKSYEMNSNKQELHLQENKARKENKT